MGGIEHTFPGMHEFPILNVVIITAMFYVGRRKRNISSFATDL
jgi:hypothetical protein